MEHLKLLYFISVGMRCAGGGAVLAAVLLVALLPCLQAAVSTALQGTIHKADFFNPALGTQQTLRVIVPYSTTSNDALYKYESPHQNISEVNRPTVFFLHPFQNYSRGEMAQLLDQSAQLFQHIMFCLTMPVNRSSYCFDLESDFYCSFKCLQQHVNLDLLSLLIHL